MAQLSGQCLSEGQDNVFTNEALVQGKERTSPCCTLSRDRKRKRRLRSWSSSIRSRGAATLGPSLGPPDWRKAQSAPATNLGSRSVQTAAEPWSYTVTGCHQSTNLIKSNTTVSSGSFWQEKKNNCSQKQNPRS